MMLDAIVARLRGQNTGLQHTSFSEPWQTYYKALEDATPGQEMAALSLVAKPEHIAVMLQHEPTEKNFESLETQQYQINPITWYWEKWLVKGKVNLIGAYPGVGKTTVNVDLARIQIHEKTFPDGQPVKEPGKPVLYIDGEGYKEGILQRAKNMQIDLNRFYLWSPSQDDVIINFSLQQHQDELVERIYKIKPACIFADSLSFFLLEGDKDIKDVRSVLSFFGKVASEFDLPVVLTHHPRKKQVVVFADDLNKRLTLDDFRGSSLIGAIARVVIGISPVQTTEEPNEEGPRVMYQIKNNEGRKLEIGFDFMPLFSGGVGIKWGAPAKPFKKPDQVDLCKDWLENLLKEEGELEPKQVFTFGKEESFTEATIRRAKKLLGAQVQGTRKSKHDPDNTWRYVEAHQIEYENGTDK
jgi:hypothetical protein